MERQFGRDFSGVRVHDGHQAATSADDLRAAAYTTGSSIVFARDRYSPQTAPGRRLIAHELAHVVQQRDAGRLLPEISSARDVSELAAARCAGGGSGERPSVVSAVPVIQRQPAEPDRPFMSITKRADGGATDEEIETALTAFLTRVLQAQGGHELRDDELISTGLKMLAGGDFDAVMAIETFLADRGKARSPGALAMQARGHLPSYISPAQLKRLDALARQGTDAAVKGKYGTYVDDLHHGRTPTVDQPPASNVQPPPKISDGAGDKILPGGEKLLPGKGTWGGPPPAKTPATGSSAPVDVEQVIQGLSDDALVPAGARGKPIAAELNRAQAFAWELVRRIVAAHQAKGSRAASVAMTLSAGYRQVSVDDQQAVLDAVEKITRAVAAALPDDASTLEEVMITVGGGPPGTHPYPWRTITLR